MNLDIVFFWMLIFFLSFYHTNKSNEWLSKMSTTPHNSLVMHGSTLEELGIYFFSGYFISIETGYVHQNKSGG